MAYYPADASYFSRRGLIFAAIIALHILAIWGFATGLADSGVRYMQTILQTNIIQTEKPKDLPPPPPPVDLKERPPVQVIVPEFNISVPVDAPPPIQVVTTRPPPAPAPVIIVPGTAIVAVFPSTADYYPDASNRMGEEGRAIIKYCVSSNSKVDSIVVDTSSGFPRLDEAAVSLVKAASRIKAATQGGKPIASCKDVAVKFVNPNKKP